MTDRCVLANKAWSDTEGAAIPDAQILFTDDLHELDDVGSIESMDLTYKADAQAIEDLLYNTLPGGTYDRLCGAMLARKSTHFRVSHGA